MNEKEEGTGNEARVKFGRAEKGAWKTSLEDRLVFRVCSPLICSEELQREVIVPFAFLNLHDPICPLYCGRCLCEGIF